LLAYSNMTHPAMWFFWLAVFSLIGLGLYLVDLKLIRETRGTVAELPGGREFIDSIERRHLYELRVQVIGALVFNLVAFALLLLFPATFGGPAAVAALGSLCALATFAVLVDCARNFKERSALVGKFYGSEE
jgi:hypothetical protein